MKTMPCGPAMRRWPCRRRSAATARRCAARTGSTVQIRVGLNSGEVVVRAIGNDLHMDYSAIGQTTHLAARMEQLAHAREHSADGRDPAAGRGVRPGQAAWARCRSRGCRSPWRCSSWWALARPGRACRRLRRGGSPASWGGRRSSRPSTRPWSRPGPGHGQVVAVIGEPGVGKSRLFYEFTHAPSHPGLAPPREQLGLLWQGHPLSPRHRPAQGLLPDRGPRRRAARSARRSPASCSRWIAALGPTLPAFLALLDVPVEDPQWQALDPPQRRQRTLDALKRLLLRESQVQPLLLVFENLHWIDAETQAFLDSLVESLPDRPPAPPGQLPPRVPARLGQQDLLHPAPARPAAPGERRGTPAGPPGGRRRAGAAQAALDRAHRGQPLLPGGERADPGGDAGAGRRAGGLSPGAGRCRASRCRPRCRRCWRRASTGCRRRRSASCRPPPSSARRCPSRSSRPLPRCPRSRSAWASPICRPPSSSTRRASSPSIEYTFKHALTQEVAYETLLQERRRALHARIVEALEALAGDRVAEQVERLAHHALRGEVWDKALAYCRQAGEKAMARSAYREAVGYFEQALSALPHLPETARHARAGHRSPARPALGALAVWRLGAYPGVSARGRGPRGSPRRPASAGTGLALSVRPFPLHGRV